MTKKFNKLFKHFFIILFVLSLIPSCGSEYTYNNGMRAPTLLKSISLSSNSGTQTRSVPIPTIILVFGGLMDPSTLNSNTVVFNCGSQSIAPGAFITTDNTTFQFSPASKLPASTLCTLVVTTGVKNILEVPLGGNVTFAFTTKAQDLYALSILQSGGCDTDVTPGALSNCIANPGINSLNNPFGIATTNGFAYILNNISNIPGSGVITKCTLGSNGVMVDSTCTGLVVTPTTSAPQDVVTPQGITSYTDANGNAHLYFTDQSAKVFKCDLDSSGNLPTCTDLNVSPILNPGGIVISTSAIDGLTYLYVMSPSSGFPGLGHVTICPLNTNDGSINALACFARFPTAASYVSNSVGGLWMAIDASNKLLYFTNPGTNVISRCAQLTGGSINTSCSKQTISAGSQFQGITLSADGTKLLAVTVDGTGVSTGVVSCTLSATGLTSCSKKASGQFDNNGPLGIAAGGSFVYVTNTTNYTVTSCNSSFTACQNSNANNLAYAKGLVVAQIGGTSYEYISSFFGSTIARCILNPNTMLVTSCQNLSIPGSMLSAPTGLAVNNSLLYFVEGGNLQLGLCPINSDGTTTPALCLDSGFNFAAKGTPVALAFQNNLAYVLIQNGTFGEIDACTLNVDGTFGNTGCVNTTASGFSGSGPAGIAFYQTKQNGLVAYVSSGTSDTDSVQRCTVNSTSFTNCGTDSGAGAVFANPQGLAVVGNNLFVANFDSSIKECSINPNTGVVSSCLDAGINNSGLTAQVLNFNSFVLFPY